MDKEKYERTEIEIIGFSQRDVIATSGQGDEFEGELVK